MKIPKIFIPNKNLESKIRELLKESKNHHFGNTTKPDYNELDIRIIYNRAKKIVEKLGKLDSISSVYAFEDKKTGIVIEYDPWWVKDQTTHLNILTKNCSPTVIMYTIVFESVHHNISKQQEISWYVPGDWQNCLKQLYKRAQQK